MNDEFVADVTFIYSVVDRELIKFASFSSFVGDIKLEGDVSNDTLLFELLSLKFDDDSLLVWWSRIIIWCTI